MCSGKLYAVAPEKQQRRSRKEVTLVPCLERLVSPPTEPPEAHLHSSSFSPLGVLLLIRSEEWRK